MAKKDTQNDFNKLLLEKKYPLSAIGISDKMAFDWTRAGLYLEEKKTKGRRKYNPIEYVWLRLVKDLREFGLSYDSIKNVKDFLLDSLGYAAFMSMVYDGQKDYMKEAGENFKSKQDDKVGFIIDMLNQEQNLVNTPIGFFISMVVHSKANVSLVIEKNGDTHVDFRSQDGSQIYGVEDYHAAPRITYPLKYVVADFVAREDLTGHDLMEDVVELNDDEKKLLDLLREGGISSLTVRLNDDNEITLIEREENLDLRESRARLCDLMARNSYQDITIKSADGKVVSIKRTTKMK